MSKSDFKKEIETFEKILLVDLIIDVYQKNAAAKEYLNYPFNPC
jgi:hypothetical protein